jgi:hypothetical protein
MGAMNQRHGAEPAHGPIRCSALAPPLAYHMRRAKAECWELRGSASLVLNIGNSAAYHDRVPLDAKAVNLNFAQLTANPASAVTHQALTLQGLYLKAMA